ncbi:MAG: hypothetical protein ACPGGB_05075, partial [Flavobacteriales bacterium]
APRKGRLAHIAIFRRPREILLRDQSLEISEPGNVQLSNPFYNVGCLINHPVFFNCVARHH